MARWMARWHIMSRRASWLEIGIFRGRTKAEALLALHRNANVGANEVWLDEDEEIAFRDNEVQARCGDVEDWIITEVPKGRKVKETVLGNRSSWTWRK